MEIKDYIIKNFEESTKEEINETIVESVKSNDEVVLPGMGVLFEIVWKNSDLQDKIVDIIFNSTRKSH